MRQNPHVRICGGPGAATTLVYPTALQAQRNDSGFPRGVTCTQDSHASQTEASEKLLEGIDAPICQDIPLGGTRDGLARAEVCHDTVVDLAGEEAFETPDDLASGPTVRGPSRDVVEGRLGVPHADDDGARAALACRCPPRLRRCRPVVTPDEAGMGHAP